MLTELRYIKTAFYAEWLKIKGLGLILLAAICAVFIPVFIFIIKSFLSILIISQASLIPKYSPLFLWEIALYCL